MATDVVIQDAEGMVHVTLNGTVAVGEPIAHNGTNWVQADASDATTNLYAQYIAGQGGVSTQEIQAYRACTIYDADAPYTANATQFLSATAGAITETRPTTNGDVIQILGRALDTSHIRIDIKAPYEVEVFYQPSVYDTTNEPGAWAIDSPAWVGPALDTGGEDCYFVGRIPSNAIALSEAKVVFNSIGETTGTIDLFVITAYDGETNTGDTGLAYTATISTGLADNIICYNDATTIFDADAFKADYNFTVAVTGGGTFAGNLQCIGLYMRYLCV
uniref:Uncharacterized protein n=1 Tax=viral metagenome TaxID=1070528 RepID=A0A6M3KEE1_9ZZZZ